MTAKTFLTALALGVMFLAAPVAALAGNRHALVIMVNDHGLRAATGARAEDAALVFRALERAGYATRRIDNPDRDTMMTELREMSAALRSDAVALVYFIGEALSRGGETYLLLRGSGGVHATEPPPDASVLEASRLLAAMKWRGVAATVLALDLRGPGLPRPNPEADSFTLVSAGPGQTGLMTNAPQPDSPHKLFARAFVAALGAGDLSVQEAAVRIRRAVWDAAQELGADQYPAYADGLPAPLTLTGTAPVPEDMETPRGVLHVRHDVHLNARTGPGTEHEVIAVLAPREQVEELHRDEGWSMVGVAGLGHAWVSNQFLVPPAALQPLPARDWTRAELLALEGHAGGVTSVSFSSNSRFVLSTARDGTARVWDLLRNRVVAVLRGHDGPVRFGAFTPDNRMAMTVGADGTARLWDIETERAVMTIAAASRALESVALTRDGRRALTAGFDGAARVWDLWTGEEVLTLGGGGAPVMGAAFDPAGEHVVLAVHDNAARVARLAEGGEIVARLEGHEDGVLWASFSPDGARIVTASRDRTARIWEAETGHQISVLRGHGLWLETARFSPDGRQVVTASHDGTAIVWDAASGHELARLDRHGDAVWGAVFSVDGAAIATASADGLVRVWRAPELR